MVVVKLYLILNSGQFWIDFWWGKVCWLIVDFGVFLPHNKIELWLESGYGCTSPILGKIGENLTDKYVSQHPWARRNQSEDEEGFWEAKSLLNYFGTSTRHSSTRGVLSCSGKKNQSILQQCPSKPLWGYECNASREIIHHEYSISIKMGQATPYAASSAKKIL
jgi:hypothetical protein